MYTQCPECRTIFEIDEDALQASLGIVHCGHCSARFDALRTLSNTLPADPAAVLPERNPVERAPTLTEAVPTAALESAAKRRRKKTLSAPASEPAATPSAPEPANDWLAGLHTDLTAALIADAADIPRETPQESGAWRVLELPVDGDIKGQDNPPVALTPVASDVSPLEMPGAASSTHVSTKPAPPEPEIAMDAPGFESPADESRIVPPAGEPSCDEADARADASSAATVPETLTVDAFETSAITNDVAEPAAVTPEAESEPDVAQAVVVSDPTTRTARSGAFIAPAPVYVRPARRHRIWLVEAGWALGCIVLALMLAAQLGWIERVALFRNHSTRSWVTNLCATLSCRLPPIRDTAKLELLSRDIRPMPDTPGALSITATVRNDAAFRQPWPVVVVELTDLDNNPVAMRRFRPVEYMPDPVQRAAGIGPGATVAIAFEVADPGKNAVAFQFNFE